MSSRPPEQQAAELEARRGRAAVLRAFETTTLTRANFCALKGMNDAALEAILVQARAERGQRPR
jgi:ProP effector